MPSVCFPVAGLNPTLPFLPAGDSLDTLLLSCFLSLLFLSIIFLSLFLNLFHSLKFGFCFLFLVVSLFFSLPKKNTKMGEDSHQPPKSVTRPAPLPPHTHTHRAQDPTRGPHWWFQVPSSEASRIKLLA